MTQILRDNAFEAWAQAIKNCDAILEGKATLRYRKQFVSNLHNAVELFIKQKMLNDTNKDVAQIRKKYKAESKLVAAYNASTDLNKYFLDSEVLDKFSTATFDGLVKNIAKIFPEYLSDRKESLTDDMRFLQKLRNEETHFYINADKFLEQEEFLRLYNFMITFYSVLQRYRLLPFWGRCCRNSRNFQLCFVRKELTEFRYEKALQNAKFVRELKIRIEGEAFATYGGDGAYEIAYNISRDIEQYQEENFEELWAYVEMLLHFKKLTYIDDMDEIEDEDMNIHYTSWRVYTINI